MSSVRWHLEVGRVKRAVTSRSGMCQACGDISKWYVSSVRWHLEVGCVKRAVTSRSGTCQACGDISKWYVSSVRVRARARRACYCINFACIHWFAACCVSVCVCVRERVQLHKFCVYCVYWYYTNCFVMCFCISCVLCVLLRCVRESIFVLVKFKSTLMNQLFS